MEAKHSNKYLKSLDVIVGSYTEQAKRTLRSFDKLPRDYFIKNASDVVWDDYMHFFQDAYHLKDWIIWDENNSVSENEVNKVLESEPELKLLQAIVTKMKHFKITRLKTRFVNINFQWKEENEVFYPEIAYEEEGYLMVDDEGYLLTEDGDKLIITSEKRKIHPKDLAEKVLLAWEDFLKQQILRGNFELIKDWDLKLRS